MNIQAELSYYPLAAKDISSPIREFCEELKKSDLPIRTGTMSSIVDGECGNVMQGINKAIQAVGSSGPFVLMCKISNACQIKPKEEE
jgi:uncharacterized protein YqgV (UPF0045/DUF77 family)